MERGEESGVEIWWEKLRRVGKRGGYSTPAASFWRINELSGCGGVERLHDSTNSNQIGTVSSRKLAAALWELHHYEMEMPLHSIRGGGGGGATAPTPGLRRRRRVDKDVGGREPFNPPPTSFNVPKTSMSLRMNVAKLLMQHRGLIEESNRATRPVSPSTCSSSMEIAPCSSSVESKGTNRELTTRGRLATSTELLKVMNRVWSLEEQHVSNMSLIKELKRELDRARFHAKELAREDQGGRHDMNELMKHYTGSKLDAENNEKDRIKAKVESTRDELNKERIFRKRSESLQRKIAKELYEVKSSLSSISKELEKERISRGLVEDLCDELAWGLRDCEKGGMGERDDCDQLIFRMSKAWLDERMQVKQKNRDNVGEKSTTIHNQIESSQMLRFQKSSLESIPPNLVATDRQEEDDNDDGDDGSSTSQSNCFEVEKTSESSLKSHGLNFQDDHFEEILKQDEFKQKREFSDWTRSPSPSRLQAKFEEHMRRVQITVGKGNPGEIAISKKAENIAEDKQESGGIDDLEPKYVIDNIIRNYYSFPEKGMQSDKDHLMDSSLGGGYQSPVREWTENLLAQDPDTSELLTVFKESTLRSNLSGARSRDQKSHSRQKASIYPSRE